ncbi:MAG: uroporphyrinogen-III synthase [Mariprofundales bacterium]
MGALMGGHCPAVGTSLAGRTILVTRAQCQAQATVRAVEQRGGTAALLPCLEVAPIPSGVAMAISALQQDAEADVLFTSVNGVESLRGGADSVMLLRWIGDRRVVAVGARTAQALCQLGVAYVAQPQEASQLGVAAWWDRHGWPARLIFVRARSGRDDLMPLLAQHSSACDLCCCYQTRVPNDTPSAQIVDMLGHNSLDAVLLGSQETARGFVARVGIKLARRPLAVAISPRVAEAATAMGLRVQVVAQTASFEAMLDALSCYFSAGGS